MLCRCVAFRVIIRTNTDDGQSFVREDGLLPAVAARPVGPSVADLLRARDQTRSFRGGIVNPMGYDNSAHGVDGCMREEV